MDHRSSTTHLTPRNVRKRRTVRTVLATVVALAAGTVTTVIATQGAEAAVPFPVENLDGSSNNVANPTWGQTMTPRYREMILGKEELLSIFDETQAVTPRRNPRITGYPKTGDRHAQLADKPHIEGEEH